MSTLVRLPSGHYTLIDTTPVQCTTLWVAVKYKRDPVETKPDSTYGYGGYMSGDFSPYEPCVLYFKCGDCANCKAYRESDTTPTSSREDPIVVNDE